MTTILVLPAIAASFIASTSPAPVVAQFVHWYCCSTLLLCAIGVAIIGRRPQHEERYSVFAVAALLALSFSELALRDAWPAFFVWVDALHRYPFLLLVSGAAVACAIYAAEARRGPSAVFAPAIIVYIGGLIAAALTGDHDLEHPFSNLVAAAANLGRMLGPALLVRAVLQHLSPPTQPAAIRFLLMPSLVDVSAPRSTK